MRLFLFLFLVLCFFSFNAYAKTLLQNAQSYSTKEFEILQIVTLKKHLHEISDIAYDAQSGILYAIGDRGDLYHLLPRFDDKKLVDVSVLARYGLTLKTPMKKIDSEGLALFGDKLAISFEGEPNILLFTKKGREVARVVLPRELQTSQTYKGKNQMLEALAYSSSVGLVTTPQSSHTKYHTLYNVSKMQVQRFRKSTQVSGFAFTPKDNLLVIERINSKKKKEKKKTKELLIKYVKTKSANEYLESRIVVSFKNKDPITKNYEGLSHYKDNLYFMMNDNDDKEATYLVLFRFDEK